MVGVIVFTSRVVIMKEHLPFCREFRTLCIEDRVTIRYMMRLALAYDISNSCGVWWNREWKDRKTDQECDKDCIEVRLQLARVKFDRDDEGDRKALGMRCCSINICDGSELNLAWPRKNSSCYENNFQTFLLSGKSKISF